LKLAKLDLWYLQPLPLKILPITTKHLNAKSGAQLKKLACAICGGQMAQESYWFAI
jgi:hypothetical protein